MDGWACSDNNTFYKNDGNIDNKNNSDNSLKNYIKSVDSIYWYDSDG